MTRNDWNSLYSETGLGDVEVWELEVFLVYRKLLMGRTAWDRFVGDIGELCDVASGSDQLH